MNVQSVLDTATSVNAASFGLGEAAKIYRDSFKNSYKVRVNLKPQDRRWVEKVVPFPLVFTGEFTVTHDHPLLCAMRQLARDIYENEFKVSHSALPTLTVGATMREIKMYHSNPHIHHYVHGKENKDFDRVVKPALESIVKMLKQKVGKSDYRVYLKPGSQSPTEPRGILKRYMDTTQVFEDYMRLGHLPATIHTAPVQTEVLLFEDSIYNLGEDGITGLFASTGAKVGYGYGLFPSDLVFPDIPSSRVYAYNRVGKLATLTFPGGHSNGYVHDHDKWSAILQSPVLRGNGVTVAVEITARVGPMLVFKLYKCDHTESIVRGYQLEDHEEYVRVLDVYASVNIKTGKSTMPLKYFSVRESEFHDTLLYLLALDPKSLSLQNCLVYIRRRMGGMSLLTKELVAPWDLAKHNVYKFAITVTLQAMLLHEKSDLIMSNLAVTSVWAKFEHLIDATIDIVGRALVPKTVRDLVAWLTSEHLTGRLITTPRAGEFQLERVFASGSTVPVDIAPSYPNEEDLPDCSICSEMHGKLGLQKIKCEHKMRRITLQLSDDQVANLHTSLIDNDEDPPGLKAVKDRAAKAMPKCGFKKEVLVYYIRGGPGCGKSHFIRTIADETDLVVAPFTKLKPDYEHLINAQGDEYDLMFKTTHRAMEMTGYRRLFFDEFTSFPYEMLACIAQNNGAEEIFLVGDESQTKVQEPTEGMYIGNYIDLSAVSKHTLLVNFRNPPSVVALLNKVYGYEMEAYCEVDHKIEFVGPGQTLPDGLVAMSMAFSHVSAKLNTGSEKNTVRSNQGGTYTNCVLYANSADRNLLATPELAIVALSRHKEKLYIVHDGGLEAKGFIESLGYNEEFFTHIQTWLTFVREDVEQVISIDKDVEVVCKPHQPPKDSYLLAETYVRAPAYAGDTSLNELASQVVVDTFKSGEVSVDFMAPVNQRGHPKGLVDIFYSHSAGNGLHYSSKKPMQTLQVLAARYLNKKPTFRLDADDLLYARSLVQLYIKEHHKESYKAFDNSEIAHEVGRFITACREKNYVSQFKGLDNADGRMVRFELKGIFKPKLGDFDPYKPGQGISAWSKDALSMFCLCWRLIGNHVRLSEMDHVVTDHGISEHEFVEKVAEQFNLVPAVALNGTTDGEMFDSQQNKFTQMIEREYYAALGISEEFLDHYYSFRSKYTIQAADVRGLCGDEKTSGEPGTLLNNGTVAKIFSNAIIRGEGPQCLIYKGDDFNKRQCNLRVDLEARAKIEGRCPLRLKVSISPDTEFCGLMLADGALVPGVLRRLNKLLGHRFRDYKHFAEYQKSIRNFVDLVERLGYNDVMAGNALAGKCDVREVIGAYETFVSFGHIDKATFDVQFARRMESDSTPMLVDNNLVVTTM